MKQYNIYAGLGGSFGGAHYQYTALCMTLEEAIDEAYECACEEYEQHARLRRLPSWEDAVQEYCEDNGLAEENITDEDSQDIEEYYNDSREDWLDYRVVPTDEDDIDEEDLILGYVIEDDSTSQTNS